MPHSSQTPLASRTIVAFLLAGLLLLSYLVLQNFLIPVAWASILAYTTWPIHRAVRRWLPQPNLAALITTLVLTAAFVAPLIWLIALLTEEVGIAVRLVREHLAAAPLEVPASVRDIPWIGQRLFNLLTRYLADPTALQDQLATWAQGWTDEVGGILGSAGRNILKVCLALLTVFFLYRDGESLIAQVRRVLEQFVGGRVHGYLNATAATTRAVVYGLVLTALVQGLLAGFGYWGAELPAPVVLGAITALLALIPFGTPVVWGSAGIWLVLSGHTASGVGLLLWGALVVSSVDNFIRPIVISSATQIPFLLVLFGVLGGLAAFGLVGLFLGPIVLAVLLAVWQEWSAERSPSAP